MTATEIDNEVVALKQYPTALITDALRRLGVQNAWTSGLAKRSTQSSRMVGRAVILNYAWIVDGTERNVAGQFDIIEQSPPGSILLYAALGVDAWLIGDNVANFSRNFDLGGIAVDGGARDADDLADFDLPVFTRSLSTAPYANKIWLEAVNSPTRFAGAQVKHGDIVVGDTDGIVIVPKESAADLIIQLADLEKIELALGNAIAQRSPLSEINKIASRKSVLYQA
jgi:regulator of RNase E activity RraA